MAVVIAASVVDSDAPTVKAYIDSLAITTLNNLSITALSAQKVLVVVEGT